jgi:hypothetical protein
MEPKVGSFCWFELATSDRVGAKISTHSVRWTAQDNPWDRKWLTPYSELIDDTGVSIN